MLANQMFDVCPLRCVSIVSTTIARSTTSQMLGDLSVELCFVMYRLLMLAPQQAYTQCLLCHSERSVSVVEESIRYYPYK